MARKTVISAYEQLVESNTHSLYEFSDVLNAVCVEYSRAHGTSPVRFFRRMLSDNDSAINKVAKKYADNNVNIGSFTFLQKLELLFFVVFEPIEIQTLGRLSPLERNIFHYYKENALLEKIVKDCKGDTNKIAQVLRGFNRAKRVSVTFNVDSQYNDEVPSVWEEFITFITQSQLDSSVPVDLLYNAYFFNCELSENLDVSKNMIKEIDSIASFFNKV